MPDRCYLCRDELIEVPNGHQGPLQPKHRTRDHVPPQGLFLAPKPDNLICLPCCHACNGGQSSFDEKLRILVAMDINANDAGRRVMVEKVLGSTMANARQPKFVTETFSTMRDVVINTPAGAKEATSIKTRSDEIFPGIIRISKGLLTHFHPEYNFRADEFFVLDIHAGTLVKGDTLAQLAVVKALVTQARPDKRGNHDEFKFWRHVGKDAGIWLLVFYDAMHFVVWHESAARAKARAS